MITASQVKELRERTNVGMMECKAALKETDGDIDAAIKYLRDRGAAKAVKKADRAANEGAVETLITDGGKSGLILELNCETDFVSKNDNFKAFVADVAQVASATESLEEALAAPKDDSTLDAFIKGKVIELGENLQFRRMVRYDLAGNGAISSYIHMGGKVGVLLEITAGNEATAQSEAFANLSKDVCLHIAASAPAGLQREDIPADLVDAEKDVFRQQMENSGKPADIIEKIVEGKLGKFYSEQCLLEQAFVKDPSSTVGDLVASVGKELGDTLAVTRFTRFGLGE